MAANQLAKRFFKDLPFQRVVDTFFLSSEEKRLPGNVLTCSTLPHRDSHRKQQAWKLVFLAIDRSIRGDGVYEIRADAWDEKGSYLGVCDGSYNPGTGTGTLLVRIS